MTQVPAEVHVSCTKSIKCCNVEIDNSRPLQQMNTLPPHCFEHGMATGHTISSAPRSLLADIELRVCHSNCSGQKTWAVGATQPINKSSDQSSACMDGPINKW